MSIYMSDYIVILSHNIFTNSCWDKSMPYLAPKNV